MKLWKMPSATPAAWETARARASREWQRLAPREQRLVTIAGLIVAAALVWLVAFEPAWKAVHSLQDRLPQLRAEAAQLDTVLADIQELQAGTATGALPADEVAAAVQDSLRRAGLEATTILSEAGTNTWQVGLTEAPVIPVLQWLQTLPYELRLSTPRVDLARSEGPEGRQLAGRLTGEVVVALPEGDS